MDDIALHTRTWLAFALALPNAATVCRQLRVNIPDPAELTPLIQSFIDGHPSGLKRALKGLVHPTDLDPLSSDETAEKIRLALDWESRSMQHHLLGLNHPLYPTLLRDTTDAPVLLYARGTLSALQYPQIAVVGSRKASQLALAHTQRICRELAALGVGIVSGLARGIDAAAHRGALAAKGATLAVAATQPGVTYPRQHTELAEQILASNGLIITEYAIGTQTRPWFFPQRNRIISGLSLGVLVMEAGLPSGTLTTATHAMNQGREVMAVPGSIQHHNARGCHALIKQGAALVETAEDVLDALGEPLRRCLAASQSTLELASCESTPMSEHESSWQSLVPVSPSLEKRLLHYLSQQPATVDELVLLARKDELGLDLPSVMTALGLLEIKGVITTSAGGRYTRC